jgi:hypothetical protein
MVCETGVWRGSVPTPSGEDITLLVDDVAGTPDPAFLAALPAVLAGLTRYESLARREVDHLRDCHRLEAVEGAAGEPGFTLWFVAEDETVFVHFDSGGEFTGWGAAD